MKKVKLGNTNEIVSALCLGTDSIGSKIDRETSFRLLDYYFEKGGSFLDTANFYASWVPGCSGGESETTIGMWMRERKNRDGLFIASKLGFDYPGTDGGLNSEEIEQECEKSLKRLGIDRIDLYYAHRDDRETLLEETMESFARLVKAGKVRYIGASNIKVWRIAEANKFCQLNDLPQYCAVQQRFTYLRPRHGVSFGPQLFINDDLIDFCKASQLTLIAYSILLQGAYTRSERPIPAQFAGPDTDSRLDVLNGTAKEAGVSPNQIIISWMLEREYPILPIIAGSKIEQLSENIAALEIELTEEQMKRLNTAGNPKLEQEWLR